MRRPGLGLPAGALLAALLAPAAGCRDGGDPVLLAYSLHLEGWQFDRDEDLDTFERELASLAQVAEAGGAVLTFEAGDLIDASAARGATVLADLQAAGHGVGVHADMSTLEGEEAYERLYNTLLHYRETLTDLGVDAASASGICSDTRWVEAAAEAGYSALSGAVFWCARTLEASLQPQGAEDCEAPPDCHWPWPEDFETRVKPWRVSETASWSEPDPDGALVMIPTASGLPCLEEIADDPNATVCEFTEGDIDLFVEDLERAVSLRGEGEVTTLKGTWSMGPVLDHALLEAWMDAAEPFVRRGEARWVTLDEAAAAAGGG